MKIKENYEDAVRHFRRKLGADRSFDLKESRYGTGEGVFTLFYVDGMSAEAELQKLIAFLIGDGGKKTDFLTLLPATARELTDSEDGLLAAVLSGDVALFSPKLPGRAVAVNLRHFPTRGVSEPESDRVMQGARDGFVESLLVNTALIRRRIRDPRLRMERITLPGSSKTDLALCFLSGVADADYVASLRAKLKKIRPRGVALGFQSIAESLISHGWWNPFPKIRTTERPDTAAAQLLEGSVVVLTDLSPDAMILPTSFFDYLQQTDDYYFPPLTGSYLRVVRTVILILSVVSTPLWYLALMHADTLPPVLSFLVPKDPGALPILFQLFFAEFVIDGLKIASMNTPDMLSNSLSIVGALILGDYAIEVGWFSRDVILYMAFVAIATFAQQNHELGYAFKFTRVLTLALTALLGTSGFLLGGAIFVLFLATNRTADGKNHYLYPLLPFNAGALRKLLFRVKKDDFL